MIRKEWKRMLALSMACTMTVSMAVPAVAAQEGETSLQTAEAAELQETPEQFEARTGYHLPDGYTYVLNNGFVIIQADGSPQITPVATPEPTPEETPTPTVTPTVTPTPSATPDVTTPTPAPTETTTQPSATPEATTTPEAADPAQEAEAENIPVITAFPQSVEVPVTVEDYRFWTVSASKKAAQAKANLEIKEEMSEDSRSVGSLEEGGICYILKKEEGWYYVESGNVRGFVEKKAVKKIGDKNEALLTPVYAVEMIAPAENQAYTYYRATIQQTEAKKAMHCAKVMS